MNIQHISTETTGPIFTKILHDIVTLVALVKHAYTRRDPIPFRNARATKVRSLPFYQKIGWHGNVLEVSKKGPERSSAPKTLSFGEKNCENRSSTSVDIWQNMPNPTWTRNAIFECHLVLRQNYWTYLHRNFTRYSGSNDAIKPCIYRALVHSVSERQSNEWRWSILTLPKCSKINWLP